MQTRMAELEQEWDEADEIHLLEGRIKREQLKEELLESLGN